MSKMSGKRMKIILLIALMISFMGFNNQTKVESSTFQKIELSIFNLTWSVRFAFKDTTTFQFVANVTIYNPNDSPINLTFPTVPLQIIGTNATINLDNPVGISYNSVCGSAQQEPYSQEIPPRYSTNSSISFLIVDAPDLTELPDGSYLFENYFYGNNQTILK
jgi:LEA14-like dessication related protein